MTRFPFVMLAGAILLFGGGMILVRRRGDRSQWAYERGQQARMILSLIEPWAGTESAAYAWYQTYPIAALGGLTAEQLVSQRRVDEVLAYLEHIEKGGFA